MRLSPTHRFEIAFLSTLAAVTIILILTAVQAYGQSCEVRACRNDETYRDGYCHHQAGFPTFAKSHRAATCPAGMDLNRSTGMCTARTGCCNERPLCRNDEKYDPRRADTGANSGWCNHRGFGGSRSHTLRRCATGWTLDAARGICRQCRSDIPLTLLLPDLTFTAVSLRPSVIYAGRPYDVCFTVANIGRAVSGPFRVGGGGLGIRYGPFQNHASLAPGARRDGCIHYPTTPPAGSYRLGLTVDSLHAVTESEERNNERTVTVIVRP